MICANKGLPGSEIAAAPLILSQMYTRIVNQEYSSALLGITLHITVLKVWVVSFPAKAPRMTPVRSTIISASIVVVALHAYVHIQRGQEDRKGAMI